MIRVLVVDDQALLRDGFRSILDRQDDIEVVGEAADGAEAVVAARRTTPDVVLMDLRMPRLDGIAATERLLASERPPRVLVLTTYDTDENLFAALKAGASGFLLKDVRADQLCEAVRVAARGEELFAPQVLRRIVASYVEHQEVRPSRPDVMATLSEREREVAVHVARGLSNAEIAAQLHLSEATVKTHVNRILSKLGLRDRVQVVVLAYESGVVSPTR